MGQTRLIPSRANFKLNCTSLNGHVTENRLYLVIRDFKAAGRLQNQQPSDQIHWQLFHSVLAVLEDKGLQRKLPNDCQVAVEKQCLANEAIR